MCVENPYTFLKVKYIAYSSKEYRFIGESVIICYNRITQIKYMYAHLLNT